MACPSVFQRRIRGPFHAEYRVQLVHGEDFVVQSGSHALDRVLEASLCNPLHVSCDGDDPLGAEQALDRARKSAHQSVCSHDDGFQSDGVCYDDRFHHNHGRQSNRVGLYAHNDALDCICVAQKHVFDHDGASSGDACSHAHLISQQDHQCVLARAHRHGCLLARGGSQGSQIYDHAHTGEHELTCELNGVVNGRILHSVPSSFLARSATMSDIDLFHAQHDGLHELCNLAHVPYVGTYDHDGACALGDQKLSLSGSPYLGYEQKGMPLHEAFLGKNHENRDPCCAVGREGTV